ncbi:hypothetical protein [Chitinimonas lacunae]|uniref:3-oxoacyl-ACP synthase n=1 Tax=Chitinimonas lacunae TaxID=1963018 RepID=A0ABV8MXM4_9NEIS
MDKVALRVLGGGACCALGFRLDAAECAIRAGMDRFEESEFYDRRRAPLKVARLPLGDLWGAERLALMATAAVQDCIDQIGAIAAHETALLLLAAERERPHTEDERYLECFAAIERTLGVRFHEDSRIIPYGRAGLGQALVTAARCLEGEVRQVLLVGADSYLNAATINYFLGAGRLLESGNAYGFIPAEAAAAVLLGRDSRPGASPLQICGVGLAEEQARPDGEVPNRAIGLSEAMRSALDQAGLAPGALHFRANDHNGDPFYASEASVAYTRLMVDDGVGLPLLNLAEYLGETGAAAGPLALAYLSRVIERDDGPGRVGLLHLGNDDGSRSAVVVAYAAD